MYKGKATIPSLMTCWADSLVVETLPYTACASSACFHQLDCSEMQVRAEQPFGRSRVDSLFPPIRQGPLASPAPPAAMATAHVGVTQAQKGTPAAPGAEGPSDPGKPKRSCITALNFC